MVEMDQFVDTLDGTKEQVVTRHSTQSSTTMKEQDDIMLRRWQYIIELFFFAAFIQDLWEISEKRGTQEHGVGFHIIFFFQGIWNIINSTEISKFNHERQSRQWLKANSMIFFSYEIYKFFQITFTQF